MFSHVVSASHLASGGRHACFPMLCLPLFSAQADVALVFLCCVCLSSLFRRTTHSFSHFVSASFLCSGGRCACFLMLCPPLISLQADDTLVFPCCVRLSSLFRRTLRLFSHVVCASHLFSGVRYARFSLTSPTTGKSSMQLPHFISWCGSASGTGVFHLRFQTRGSRNCGASVATRSHSSGCPDIR